MNTSKAEGIFDQAKGKIKQTFGETTDNQSLANEGAADQAKGNLKEAWGDVKDTASNIGSEKRAEADANTQVEGHSIREKITSAAANVKDSISRGLDHLEHKAKD